MGSVYDLPPTSSRADNRTQANTSLSASFFKDQNFEKTERAVRRKPFDTFYHIEKCERLLHQ